MDPVEQVNDWFNIHVRGKKFRRKQGEIVYLAESLKIDSAYLRHYGFVTATVKLRDARNGKAVSVIQPVLTHYWVEVKDDAPAN